MWCPKCLSEYRAGIDRCESCGVALTDEPPHKDLPRQKPALMHPVYLRTFRTQMELGMARELLARNNIDCFCKQPGSGSYLLIVCGVSMYGSDLYVDGDALSDAQALLDGALAPCDEQALNAAYDAFMASAPESAADTPEEKPPHRQKWVKVVMGVCIFLFCSPALYALLLRFFQIVRRLFS